MILVDTSVWVDHLRKGNFRLEKMLHDEKALAHPFVIGELAIGFLQNRRVILGLLAALPSATLADSAEVMSLIEIHKLHGIGLGWVDVNLLASAKLTHCQLWTLDKQLDAAAATILPTAR